MANERLRQAINQAGLDPEGLADLVEVDVKTVQRWLSGRTPYTRHRAKVAKALDRGEHDLWPGLAAAPPEDSESRGEIQGAWAHAHDEGVPDWQELLDNAVDQVELLGCSLIEILSVDGVSDTLAAKADSGVRVLILVSAPDSIWVTARARELGQQEDYIGRTPLQLEIEKGRGYLEPLTTHPEVELREFCADPGHTILRFDDQMLLNSHPYGIRASDAPLLHLRRNGDGGLFDQWAGHLQAIAQQASEPIRPAPDLYPTPTTHSERYEPLTRAAYEHQLEAARQRSREHRDSPNRPLEEVRAELRRTGRPANPTVAD